MMSWVLRRSYSSSASQYQRYCLELVRKHDHDHYLCTLLLPKHVQPTVFALRAFNVEVAMIKDVVSEKNLGKVRLQFWKDVVTGLFKEPAPTCPDHPVAQALAMAIQRHSLSKLWLIRLLEEREKDLNRSVFLTTAAMEGYAENTFSSLLYLTLEALDIKNIDADHAGSHIGKAEGVVTVLRASSYHRLHKSVFIPMDILARHGACQEDLLRGNMSKQVEDSIWDFACLADAHLKKARSIEDTINKQAKKALLPAVACDSFLKKLAAARFNPFDQKLSVRNSLLPISLLVKSLKRTY